MKILLLILSCFFLWTEASFAGSLLDEYIKGKDNSIYAKPDYKTSPAIDLHSNKPVKPNSKPSNDQFNTSGEPTLYNNQQNNLNNIGVTPKK
ncbi:MAG: hypothetical protein AB9872_17025 [Solidesulfovibrio sp.]